MPEASFRLLLGISLFLCSQDDTCTWLPYTAALLESSYCEDSVNRTLDYVLAQKVRKRLTGDV